MATQQASNENQQKGDENQQSVTSPLTGGSLRGAIYEQFRKAKENAEAYPYVWASYIIVYGGFGLWVAYRYRKLRNTEDRVRTLQEQLRKLRQEREPTVGEKVSSSSSDKPAK